MQEHIENGKSFEEIIAEKKAIADPIFRYVYGVELTKEWYHCHIQLWADYTASKPEGYDGIVADETEKAKPVVGIVEKKDEETKE